MVSENTKQLAQEIQKEISQSGINYQCLNDLLGVAIYAFEKEKDEKWALKVTKYIKECCIYGIQNGIDVLQLDDLRWKTLKEEAPYWFDSYLIYLERKRDKKDKFYEPKRKHLNKHGLIQAMQDLEDDKLDILSISMPPGTQKAQPLYSKVLTPNGWKEMGNICIGDKLISGTGNICTVIGVYPQGVKPIYEVFFDDGSSCRCSDEHLWTVQTRDDRRRKNKDGTEKYRTITLNEILKNYKVENGKRSNYSIDYVPKIDCFEKKDLKIDAYVMGVLLGDGCLSSGNLNISTKDVEILENVKSRLPREYEIVYKGGCDYRIKTNVYYTKGKSDFTKALESYDLKGKKSIDKFIPKDYLYASYEQRLDLLRGLMDTDGSASKHYCSYSTISKQLAEDVKELVHSLGGYCSCNKRKAGYKKNSEYIACNDYYELIIQFAQGMDSIFLLKRKAITYRPKRKNIKRFITDIKKLEDDYCQCIYIDDESHLYITDDYIITHNTTLEKFFASWIIGRHPDDFSLFFSHSGDITRMFYDGVIDITTNTDEYCWNEIFPDVHLKATDAKRETINFNKYKPFANLQCTSVGSKNAGKVRCNRYLYCDDLIGGIEEALNKNILDKLWRIYGTDAKQRKMDGCKEIHIATRWSVHDVIGRIKNLYEDSDRVCFIEVPDIDEETGESNFDYEYNGFSVEFFNDQALAMDEISYNCLYKSKPIEREGLLYTEEELRRFLTLPIREPDAILGICDTKNKGTDYYFLPCMYQYGADYYLVDCICSDNSNYGVQYENSANLIINHNMQQCEFETNNGGDRVSYEVAKLVDEKGGRCNITDKFNTVNKETKIIVNADWVKKHILFKDKSMYSPKEDYGKMMFFLLSYTVRGKNDHDDVPDGLASFVLYVTNGLVKVEAAKNPFR